MALATIFGAAGAMLVLVGLIGGGFTFSGSIMPKVGGVSRLLCFGVGGLLLLLSLGIVVADQAGPPQEAAAGTPAPAPPAAVPPASVGDPPAAAVDSHLGSIAVPAGHTALVFEEPHTDAAVVTELDDGAVVEILCTVLGESVTSPLTGKTSSLWNGTTDGGFIPDVLVDTGTDQPTMPNCSG
jgi:hypothetical protein